MQKFLFINNAYSKYSIRFKRKTANQGGLLYALGCSYLDFIGFGLFIFSIYQYEMYKSNFRYYALISWRRLTLHYSTLVTKRIIAYWEFDCQEFFTRFFK